ncbi:hypothetical protein DFH09DRAFT_1360534 [Mycena vulgaris]|nr:hypothetical protein DFH09DRAFT_1360534 [Mycena vulgaris]
MPRVSSLASNPSASPLPPAPAIAANFLCDACGQAIPGVSPRVHCLACPDHDLCATCALGERFGGQHTAAHATTVYRVSGDATVQPLLSQASISYTRSTNAGATPSANFHQFSSTAGTTLGGSVSEGGTASTVSSAGSTYPSHNFGAPPASVSLGGTAASVQPSHGWTPFFDTEMNPTSIFIAVMGALFAQRDRAGTGFLAPEVYSRLLDDMGYPVEENVWKSRLGPETPTQPREAPADAALKLVFDMFAIDHAVQTRPATHYQNAHRLINGIPVPPMPMLTSQGLVAITTIEALSDPAGIWPRLSHIVEMYGLYSMEPYRHWGPMPRGVLPEQPDPRMLNRIAAA